MLGACSDKALFPSSVHFHHTHAAGTVRSQFLHVAQGGNLDAQSGRGCKNGGLRRDLAWYMVDFYMYPGIRIYMVRHFSFLPFS